MFKKSRMFKFMALFCLSTSALAYTQTTQHHYIRHHYVHSNVHHTTRHTSTHASTTSHIASSHRGSIEQVGLASWYGPQFQGRETASGTRFNMYALTAASKTIRLNTYVRVTDLANGKSVIVKVNDRGPYVGSRILDLSYAAAERLGTVHAGVARVKIESI